VARSSLHPASVLDRFRYQDELTGTKNGVNAIFTTAEDFVQGTIQIYWNGVRLFEGVALDYTTSESGGVGTGFDTVTFTAGKMPVVTDFLAADYVAAS